MPAITVPDITVLPRIPEPDPAIARPAPGPRVTSAPRGFEGEGFPVRRAFAGVDLADLDPFVHLDQMGEVEYAPGEPKGTPWHPHRGFETVTYMIDGTFEHSDSNGGGGVITNGDTQWMTAGAGILHIEKPPEWLVASGGLFHGFQLWVNLPRRPEVVARRATRTSAASEVALVCVARRRGAGPGDRRRGRRPRRARARPTRPMTLVHATLSPGAPLAPVAGRLQRPRLRHGRPIGTVGRARRAPDPRPASWRSSARAMRSRSAAADAEQESRSPNLDVLILGGRPIREPVAWMGPFVMNTREEVMQAVADYQAGRLGTIPAIHAGAGAPDRSVNSRRSDDDPGVLAPLRYRPPTSGFDSGTTLPARKSPISSR